MLLKPTEMIPFKTLSAFRCHTTPGKSRIYFLSTLSFFLLPVSIYVKRKVSKLILRNVGNKMCPHFMLFKDVFRGTEAEA